jgi:hypothetical protein
MNRGQVVYTLHLWPPLGHAAHYTGTTQEPRLATRLHDHAMGRGARLTQVQVERGGFWVLAQTEPGGRVRERQLKQHGATRRCEVCKAVAGFQAGDLAAEDALGRAGWDRSNPVQRSMLLDIFGLPEPPAALQDPALAAPAAPEPEAWHSFIPAPREPEPEPRPCGQPAPPDPVLEAAVSALEHSWATPTAQPDAHPPPELIRVHVPEEAKLGRRLPAPLAGRLPGRLRVVLRPARMPGGLALGQVPRVVALGQRGDASH